MLDAVTRMLHTGAHDIVSIYANYVSSVYRFYACRTANASYRRQDAYHMK